MRRRIVLLAISLGLLAGAARAQSSGILTDVVSQYESASQSWIEHSADITRNLFASLVLLELAVTLVVALLHFIGGSAGIGKLSTELVRQVA